MKIMKGKQNAKRHHESSCIEGLLKPPHTKSQRGDYEEGGPGVFGWNTVPVALQHPPRGGPQIWPPLGSERLPPHPILLETHPYRGDSWLTFAFSILLHTPHIKSIATLPWPPVSGEAPCLRPGAAPRGPPSLYERLRAPPSEAVTPITPCGGRPVAPPAGGWTVPPRPVAGPACSPVRMRARGPP